MVALPSSPRLDTFNRHFKWRGQSLRFTAEKSVHIQTKDSTTVMPTTILLMYGFSYDKRLKHGVLGQRKYPFTLEISTGNALFDECNLTWLSCSASLAVSHVTWSCRNFSSRQLAKVVLVLFLLTNRYTSTVGWTAISARHLFVAFFHQLATRIAFTCRPSGHSYSTKSRCTVTEKETQDERVSPGWWSVASIGHHYSLNKNI